MHWFVSLCLWSFDVLRWQRWRRGVKFKDFSISWSTEYRNIVCIAAVGIKWYSWSHTYSKMIFVLFFMVFVEIYIAYPRLWIYVIIWLLYLSFSGKNALHLASRNGHSLCVQKLLQVKCLLFLFYSHFFQFFMFVCFAFADCIVRVILRAVSLSAPLNNYDQTSLAA